MTFLAVFTARRLRVPGARWFLVYLLGQMSWLLAQFAELLVPHLDAKIALDALQYAPASLIAGARICFALAYSGHRVSRRVVLWLFLAPLPLVAALAATPL